MSAKREKVGKESAKKRLKNDKPDAPLKSPQEMEKITLGKRLATQIEIEFDREAIIRAEKESMEKEKILNQSFNNTTMISAN